MDVQNAIDILQDEDYLRMQPAMFDEILNRVVPRIQKKDTNTFAIINAFAAFRASLLLIMIGLHYDHEVQVTLTRRFAMTTFSPRKF